MGTLRPLLQPECRSCSRLATAIITAGSAASGDRPVAVACFSLSRRAYEAAGDSSARSGESLFARHSRGYRACAHAPRSTSRPAQGLSSECSVLLLRPRLRLLGPHRQERRLPRIVSPPTGSRFPSRSSRFPTMSPNRAPAAPRAQVRPPPVTPDEVLRGLSAPPPGTTGSNASRTSPALLGRFRGPLNSTEGRSGSGSSITVEPRSDPAAEAAIRSRVQKQIQQAVGDRVRSVEVRVSGRNVLIRAQAARFWQRRGVQAEPGDPDHALGLQGSSRDPRLT